MEPTIFGGSVSEPRQPAVAPVGISWIMLPYLLSQSLNFLASHVLIVSFLPPPQSRQIPSQNIMKIFAPALLLVVTAIAGNKVVCNIQTRRHNLFVSPRYFTLIFRLFI